MPINSKYFSTLQCNTLKTDSISEENSAAGVTIDSLLIKDGRIVPSGSFGNSLASTALASSNAPAIEESGYIITCDSSAGALTVTLPAMSGGAGDAGVTYTFVVTAAGNAVNLSPAAGDWVRGFGLNAGLTDNKDLILASPAVGDWVKLVGNAAATTESGWNIVEGNGTFTLEA